MKKKRKATSDQVKSSTKAEFLRRVRQENPMIEYITKLKVMNPAAEIHKQLNKPRREGGFVRLAHARDEFTAPHLTKGKSVLSRRKKG